MLTREQRAACQLAIRRQSDACWRYRPNPVQRRALQSRKRYRLIRGVNRGGKTAHNAFELAAAARRIHPTRTTSINGLYLLFAPHRDQINDPWAKKLLKDSELMNLDAAVPFIPAGEIESSHYTHGAGVPTLKEIILKNGNRIVCFPSNTKDVWKKIEGKGMVLGIVADEAVGGLQFITECATRLLDANSHPVVVREAGGGWFLWGATQNKDNPALDQLVDQVLADPEKYSDYEVFTLTPEDNPAISKDERQKLRLLMTDDEFEVRMQGTATTGGQMAVFPQWDDKLHWLTTPHVPSPTANYWVGYDPGTNYTGMLVACLERDRPLTLRVVRCWQLARSTIENDLLMLRDWLQGRFLEGFIYDQAARKIEKTGESVIGRLKRLSMIKGYDIQVKRGFNFGRSRYEDSVPVLRHYLRPNAMDATVPPLLSVNADEASGCAVLRRQIMYTHFTENAHDLKESNISKGNDHVSDALRYLCSMRPAWVDRGANPKLWGPGTAGEDPDAERRIVSMVLSESGYEQDTRMAAGARLASRRLAKLRNARRW